VTLLTAAVLALGLGALAAHRLGHIDTRILSLERDLGILQRTAADEGDPQGAGDDDVLVQLETVPEGRANATEKVGHDSLLRVPFLYRTTVGKAALLEDLRKDYEYLLTARDRVWPSVAGPIALAIFFVAISAAMLPGVEGFLVRNYQLNTMLILMIAYSWWLLLSWAVVALSTMPTEHRTKKVFRPRLFERVT
jgi:hypothetical protein